MYNVTLVFTGLSTQNPKCEFLVHEFDFVEKEGSFFLKVDSENENFSPPRGNSVYCKSNLTDDDVDDLRSCGYAVEDEILYYGEEHYTIFTLNPNEAAEKLKEEMISNTRKKMNKFEEKILLLNSTEFEEIG